MARLEIGRTLEDEKKRAETLLDDQHRNIALGAVFHLRKTVEARRQLAGERSSLIEREAKMRGVHPRVLAAQIDGLAKADEDRELARIAAKQEIRKAESKQRVYEILLSLGIKV